MRRKRVKAAKKAKLAKIKEIQAQIKNQDQARESDADRPQENETQDIDKTIKDNMKKINKSLMKKDDRFKNVIGKISKIKQKAEIENRKNMSKIKKKVK